MTTTELRMPCAVCALAPRAFRSGMTSCTAITRELLSFPIRPRQAYEPPRRLICVVDAQPSLPAVDRSRSAETRISAPIARGARCGGRLLNAARLLYVLTGPTADDDAVSAVRENANAPIAFVSNLRNASRKGDSIWRLAAYFMAPGAAAAIDLHVPDHGACFDVDAPGCKSSSTEADPI